MNDPRKEYMVQCIMSVLNIPREHFRSNTTSNTALEKFLDDPNEKVLQAVENEKGEEDQGSKRTVTLSNGFSTYVDGVNEMHFVKTSYEPLTEENIHRLVMVSCLRVSPMRSLFYNMREVFVPLLIEATKGEGGRASEVLEGRLADCLTELDAGLTASFRRGIKQRREFDEADLQGILTPIDEVRFWDDYKNTAGLDSAKTDRASIFSEALSPVANDLEDLKGKSFSQLTDLVESLTDALESLWNAEVSPCYPRERMVHFFRVISSALGCAVQAKLNGLKVWDGSFSQVAKHIREGHKLCEKWNEVMFDLTAVQWVGSENRWTGEPYKDAYLTNLAQRIQDVSQLRGQHDQILRLLPEEELRMMNIEACFDPFVKLNVFSYNEYTVPFWKSALAEYEANMAPVQNKVAERLRAELITKTSNPAQTVRVFQRYQDLLERKNIRDALTNERERLLTELGEFLERVMHELETFDPASLPPGRGLSVHVRKMMWIEHMRSKAELAARPLSSFLKDLQAAGKISSSCKRVRQELKELRARCFKQWQDEVESHLNSPDDPIALEMNSKVMEFDTAQQGALQITYSERLIQLVKEARLFEQMQCSIPRKVQSAVQNGLKFYRFAVQLKQICNFYNHLDTELLPSQKLMALEEALAFERLFTDKNSNMKQVQWAKLDQLEAFTRTVQDSAERLRGINRRLRNGHAQVGNEVVQLANISLLRQRDQWKAKVAQIQKSIDSTVVACGCKDSETNAKPWRRHWDYQMFKIMEVQYRFGLESLNENLPEMKADLILAQKQLRLKPALEELKTQYFK